MHLVEKELDLVLDFDVGVVKQQGDLTDFPLQLEKNGWLITLKAKGFYFEHVVQNQVGDDHERGFPDLLVGVSQIHVDIRGVRDHDVGVPM